MAIKCIYLDLDGVLVDLCEGVARAVGVERAPFYGPLNTHWRGVVDVLTHLTGEAWSERRMLDLFDDLGPEFWIGLKKYPWSDDLLALCERHAPTVIMTSPADMPTAAAGKLAWIKASYPKVSRYAITSCKHHLSHPGAVLIDDSLEFCEQFAEHGGSVYLFPQPWSDPTGWVSRNPLEEIREMLERLGTT